jgi:hypothetical protein
VIPIKKRPKKGINMDDIFDHNDFRDDEVEYVSMRQLLNHVIEKKLDRDVLNEKLQKTIKDYQPSIGRLATRFEVEENTVTKFLHKIGNRITLNDIPELDSPLERIVEYINYNSKTKVLDLIGMSMVPLVGEWRYGEIQIGEDLFGIGRLDKYSDLWSVFKRTPIKNNNRVPYVDEQEISYGSDEWYALFREIKDE